MTSRQDCTEGLWGKALLGLAICLALIAVVFCQSWLSMGRVWMGSVTYHHGFLILPISVFLIWQRRGELGQLLPRQEKLALPILVAFVLLWLVGRAGDIQLFQHIAVVGMTVSVIFALLGRLVCRVILFPLAFLFFMVPAGDALVPPLQDLTAKVSVFMLRATGIPVFHNGILIETPSGLFEVAEACAGIRFLIANVVIAALFAYLAFRKWQKWVVFMVLAVIVPIIANSIRAFGIIYIAYLTDNEYAVGVDHLVYGWGFSVAIMFVLLLIGNAAKDHPLGEFDGQIQTPAMPMAWRSSFVALPAVLIIGVFAYAHGVMLRAPQEISATVPDIEANAAWQVSADVSRWRPHITDADLTVERSYHHNGETVDFFLAYYAYERQGAEIVNYQHRMADGTQWIRTSSGREALDIDALPSHLSFDRMQSGATERIVLWWYWVGGEFVTEAWKAKLLQIRDRLLGRSSPAAILAVSTEVTDRLPQAFETVEAFLSNGFAPDDYLTAFATPLRSETVAQ